MFYNLYCSLIRSSCLRTIESDPLIVLTLFSRGATSLSDSVLPVICRKHAVSLKGGQFICGRGPFNFFFFSYLIQLTLTDPSIATGPSMGRAARAASMHAGVLMVRFKDGLTDLDNDTQLFLCNFPFKFLFSIYVFVISK